MEGNLLVLFLIGTVGGFMAGLVGIGGGVVMVPLFAYVAGLPFHSATALSVVQIFVASLSGVYRHYRGGSIYPRVALLIGGTSAATAAIAAAYAPAVPALWLETTFLFLVIGSAAILALPGRRMQAGRQPGVSVLPGVGLGILAGTLTGLLGAGGGFFLIPVFIKVFGLATRDAIGTSLAVVLLGSLSGAATKLATGQIDLALAAVVVVGGAIGAQGGALACYRVPPAFLRGVLFVLLGLIAVRTLASIVGAM